MNITYISIYKTSLPVLVSLLMEYLIGFTDTAYLGRVGETELAASAIAGTYYMIIYMIGFGFSIGAQILIAQYNGNQQYKEAGKILSQGILFLLIIAAIVILLSSIISPIILKSIIDSESVLQAVLQYLDWRIYGFFFSFTIIMFRAFYIGIIHTSALMLNSITMVAINVILNYILIFGALGIPALGIPALGIPALGISGAAIASVISEAVAVIHFIIYTQKNVSSCKYGLKRRITIDCTILKKILSISIWMMLQHGLVFGSWFIFFITIEHFGERSLAITNIVRNISSFLFLFVQAFASVASSLVGNLIGGNKSNSILYVCKKVIFLCYMTILPIMLLFLFFPSSVLRIYSDNTILVFEAIPTLKVMLTSYLIAVPTFVFFSAVSGIGHAVASLLIAFISLVVYIVYVETISHFSSSVPLLWTSEHIYFSCVFILSLYYIHHWWMNFINQDKKLITNVS